MSHEFNQNPPEKKSLSRRDFLRRGIWSATILSGIATGYNLGAVSRSETAIEEEKALRKDFENDSPTHNSTDAEEYASKAYKDLEERDSLTTAGIIVTGTLLSAAVIERIVPLKTTDKNDVFPLPTSSKMKLQQ